MITFVNDRKLTEYPFFNLGKTGFPPGFITYLGVCISGSIQSAPLYASAVTVSLDGVLVSLCLENMYGGQDTDLGSVFVNSADGSVSSSWDFSMGSITASMVIDQNMLSSAYGTYSGKFYLDPSCVTFMDNTVRGTLQNMCINGTTYNLGQFLEFSCVGGIIELSDMSFGTAGATAYISGGESVNTYDLVYKNVVQQSSVDSINEITLTGLSPYPTYPTFGLLSESSSISFNVLQGSTTEPSDLVVEIIGDKTFPNCYSASEDEAPAHIGI